MYRFSQILFCLPFGQMHVFLVKNICVVEMAIKQTIFIFSTNFSRVLHVPCGGLAEPPSHSAA